MPVIGQAYTESDIEALTIYITFNYKMYGTELKPRNDNEYGVIHGKGKAIIKSAKKKRSVLTRG